MHIIDVFRLKTSDDAEAPFHRIVIILLRKQAKHGLGLYKIILMRSRAERGHPRISRYGQVWLYRGHKGESLLIFSREIARQYQNQPG